MKIKIITTKNAANKTSPQRSWSHCAESYFVRLGLGLTALERRPLGSPTDMEPPTYSVMEPRITFSHPHAYRRCFGAGSPIPGPCSASQMSLSFRLLFCEVGRGAPELPRLPQFCKLWYMRRERPARAGGFSVFFLAVKAAGEGSGLCFGSLQCPPSLKDSKVCAEGERGTLLKV